MLPRSVGGNLDQGQSVAGAVTRKKEAEHRNPGWATWEVWRLLLLSASGWPSQLNSEEASPRPWKKSYIFAEPDSASAREVLGGPRAQVSADARIPFEPTLTSQEAGLPEATCSNFRLLSFRKGALPYREQKTNFLAFPHLSTHFVY